MHKDINVNVSGPMQPASTYKTVVLKGNHSFASQVTEPNRKYVIKYDFDLGGAEITIPENCVLEFDGGSLYNGSVIFNNTDLQGTISIKTDIKGYIKNSYVKPEWFGAVGDCVTDDSDVFRKMMRYAFNYHSNVVLTGDKYYKLTGDNPMGLPYITNEDAENIDFWNDDNLFGNRLQYRLNLSGNNAHIAWTPLREDDCLAFVGYLTYSTWDNLYILCEDNENFYGSVFSTHFHVPFISHSFTQNKFSHICINGYVNKVFNFERDEVDGDVPPGRINPSGAHDDLSIFEKIVANTYKTFCYIKNSQSVTNTFVDCALGSIVDNSIGFYITGSQRYNAWAGNLRILNMHYHMSNGNGSMIIKDDTSNLDDRIVYIDKIRLEVGSTTAGTTWQYFDIRSIHLHVEGMTVINQPPQIDKTHNYGIIRGGSGAKLTMINCQKLFTPIAIYGGSYTKPIRFINCSFMNGPTFDKKLPSSIIRYYSSDGEIEYNSLYEAIQAGYKYPYIINENNELNHVSNILSWGDSYNVYQGGSGGIVDNYRTVILSTHTNASPLVLVRDSVYTIPDNMIIKEISYSSNGNTALKKIRMDVLDESANIVLSITKINNKSSYYRNIPIPILEKDEYLAINRGYGIKFYYYADVDSESPTQEKDIHGTTISRIFMRYKYPSNNKDILHLQSTNLFSEDKNDSNRYSSWNEDGTLASKVDIL